jgi:hypothetical protein
MPVLQHEDHTPKRQQLKFRWLPDAYVIVRLQPDTAIPEWATGNFTSITRTAEELSIVCCADKVPAHMQGPRWICLKLEGPFALSQTGILLSFIEPLSDNGVPIFAIATYNTDYVLIQEEYSGMAISALQQAGHELWPHDDSWRKLLPDEQR